MDRTFGPKRPTWCGLYLPPAAKRRGVVGRREVGYAGQIAPQSTKPAIPGTGPDASSSTSATARGALRRPQRPRGHLAGWVTDSSRSDNFVTFLGDWSPRPRHLDLHCIADNFAATRRSRSARFGRQPSVHIHHTPTHASWLNQVELFFSILERRLLRRGEFDSVDDLARKVIAFINDYNRQAAPFRWTYDGKPYESRKSQ